MRTTRNSFLALCVTTTVFSLCAFQVRGADDSVVAILARAARTPQLSPALDQIVKLTKGGVAESVTLAFIQTSQMPYALDAQNIIKLREQGVSSQVITAMMQRNEEIRRATEEAGQTAQSTASTSVASPPSQVVSAPTQTQVVYAPAQTYPASTVSVTYFGSRESNYYPGYWGYRSGLSGSYYPGYASYACVPRYYGYGYGSRVGFGVGYSRGYGYCR